MSDPVFIPCGEYLPDQASVLGAGSAKVENVIPRTVSSYSPMPSFQTSALTAIESLPLGAYSAADASGNPANYVGTTSKLYAMLNATNPDFADKSRGTGYSTPGGYGWSFTEALGNVYASNGADPIQVSPTASATAFSDHPDSNAPIARYVTFIQPGFLLCGDINDVTVGIQPQGIRWSALGAPGSFPLVGSNDAIANNSDWQAVTGPHGRFRGFAPDLATCNAALFSSRPCFA